MSTVPEQSPTTKSRWQQGREDALAGRPAPQLVRPDGPWSARLYAAGWDRGAAEREEADKAANRMDAITGDSAAPETRQSPRPRG